MSAPPFSTRSTRTTQSSDEPPEQTPPVDSPPARGVARLWPRLGDARHVLAYAVRRASEVRLFERAGSLTYTTVLSIVPFMAVALALFAAFPRFDEYRSALEDTLFRSIMPDPIARQILRYINEFALNSAQVGFLGLAGLAVTAILLIVTIEHALNDIWQVRRRRPVAERVILYGALMTLGPLLVGASLTLTGSIAAPPWSTSTPGAWIGRGGDLFAFSVLTLALAAIYVYVPNRRVMWRDAIAGGLVAAAGIESLKSGFAFYVSRAPTATIYGAFAVAPLFLVWAYVAWWIALFGAVIAETLPRLHTTRFCDEQRAGNRFVTAVALLRALYDARVRGVDRYGVPTEQLASEARMYAADIEDLLGELEELGYVSPLSGSRKGDWVLSCDPATTGIRAIFERFAFDSANSLMTLDEAGLGPWADAAFASDWMRRPLADVFGPNPPAHRVPATE